jgi:repressor LexA
VKNLNGFKDMLKQLRERESLSQSALASKLGVSKSAISMYEAGNRQPDFETEETIADFFNVSLDFLRGKDTKNTPPKGVQINVVGRVAAGIPIEAIENIIDTEEISQKMASTDEFFGLKIKGNSMEPKISDGDIVIARKQDDAESNEIVIALVNGNEGVCKRLKKYSDSIALISSNPEYAPLIFTREEVESKPVRIIGKVVELRAKF